MTLRSARRHYVAQQRLFAVVLLGLRREWARMGDDLDSSWAQVGPRVAALVAAAQVGAASDGAAYVPEAIAEQDIATDRVRVDPRRFAGVATSLDGLTYGSLPDLLYGSVVHARAAHVGSLPERLAVGGANLARLAQTQVADAARQSAGVAIAATPRAGWTRMVNPPSCKDCAVLAGKFYRFNQGFQRHPGCDCRHVPSTEAKWGDVGMEVPTPQITGLTTAERDALDSGADLSRVVNSKRGMSADRTTTTALARRGQVRLTPEGIYRASKGNREESLRLLRAHGYLT